METFWRDFHGALVLGFSVLETSSGGFHNDGDFYGKSFTVLEISGIFIVLETYLEIFTVLETFLEGFSRCWRRLWRDFLGAGE